MKRKVAVFAGTRPEVIKLAPVVRALERSDVLEPLFVSTGQHRELIDPFLELFGLQPVTDLRAMRPGQTLAELTARLVTSVGSFLRAARPAYALVQGDTTTAFAAALASFYERVPVGHVEAGLRTGDPASPFPEEANRRLVAVLAERHFAPTASAADALRREGIPDDRIYVTGNTGVDALLLELERQDDAGVRAGIEARLDASVGAAWRSERFVLVTGHRRESFGQGFENICHALTELAKSHPNVGFVYPVHLNPRVREPVRRHLGDLATVHLVEPLPYDLFVALMKRSTLVLTDSGGIQEEAPSLGKPVLVMRATSERLEGIDAGTARLVGADRGGIVDGVASLLDSPDAYAAMARAVNPYGDGRAAPRIVAALAALRATPPPRAVEVGPPSTAGR